MDSQRNLLLMALIVVSFLLFQQWQREHAPVQPLTTPTTITQPHSAELPTSTPTSLPVAASEAAPSQPITLCSDVLALTINPQGADILEAQLLAYNHDLRDQRPLPLLEQSPLFTYQAQRGLIGPQGSDNSPTNHPLYQSQQQHYQLKKPQTVLEVPSTYRDAQGVEFRKVFTLRQGAYAVEVRHEIVTVGVTQ